MNKLSKYIILLFISIGLTTSFSEESSENNRNLLKEFALCECLAKSWDNIGFDTLDFSRALLFENLPYPKSVFDSLDLIVNNALKNSIGLYRIEDELYNINNYRCIRFYKSFFLDSILRSFDHLINSESHFFYSDSIEYENNFNNSMNDSKK
jgi:hypothetical protein